MGMIEIRKWHVLDIYWNDAQEREVKKLVKTYEKQGWTVESEDSGDYNKYENCTQLMRSSTIKTKNV